MKLFTIDELPAPPMDKRGWPWTEMQSPGSAVIEENLNWPRISIVTPSFNQGPYIEETIRSVLLQGYPNLEYFIIDGGSSDETIEIIRKYERWLTGWVSERDGGQSEAINKGFALCNGDVVNWLCSDDLFASGALRAVGLAMMEQPECDVVVGNCYCKFEGEPEKDGVRLSSISQIQKAPYLFGVWQPSCFFRREMVGRPDVVRNDMHYCMDRELWCHLRDRGARWKALDQVLSVNRFTGDNKSRTGRRRINEEIHEMYRGYEKERIPLTFWLRRVWMPLAVADKRGAQRLWGGFARLLSRAVTLALRVAYDRERVRGLQSEFYRYGI